MSFITSNTGTSQSLSGNIITYATPRVFANKIRVDTAITVDAITVKDNGSLTNGVTVTAGIWDSVGNNMATFTDTWKQSYANCFKFATPCTLQPNTDYYVGIIPVSGSIAAYETGTAGNSFTKTVDGVTFTFNSRWDRSATAFDVNSLNGPYPTLVLGFNFSVGTQSPGPKSTVSHTVNNMNLIYNRIEPLILKNGNIVIRAASGGAYNVYIYDSSYNLIKSVLAGNQTMAVIYERNSDNHIIAIDTTGQIYDLGTDGSTVTQKAVWAWGTALSPFGVIQLSTGEIIIFGQGRFDKRSADLLTSIATNTITNTSAAGFAVYEDTIILVSDTNYCTIVNPDLTSIYFRMLPSGNAPNDVIKLSNGDILTLNGNRYLTLFSSDLSVTRTTLDLFSLLTNAYILIETPLGILVGGYYGTFAIFTLDLSAIKYMGTTNHKMGYIWGKKTLTDKRISLMQTDSTLHVLNFNVPPNTPAINNPVGTSGSPAVISTITPTLSWSFSDLDSGDAQSAYQVQVENDAGTVIYDTGKVASSLKSVQVPSGTLTVGKTYSWRVCTWDSSDAIGNYSSLNYFSILTMANVGDSNTFSYTGAAQTYTVPAGVTKLKLEAWGAQGGKYAADTVSANRYVHGGKGGYTFGELTVIPGQLLTIYVGGKGADNMSAQSGSAGGYNGGGQGGTCANGYTYGGGGGGGASDIRIGGTALANRILVAGGGGGVGYRTSQSTDMYKGNGGGVSGEDGDATYGGVGGSQTAGGTGGVYSAFNGAAGTLAIGGSGGGGSINIAGGGGGGGYYGGGGGAGGGYYGGGGSGYYGTLTNADTIIGQNEGNGKVTVTVIAVSALATIATRTPGSTDQTRPTGTNLIPTLSWTFSGTYTQTKFQVKIYQGTNLVHDSGLITSSLASYNVPADILQPGIVYGWELQTTDDTNIVTPTDRVYFITNNMPGTPTNLLPLDASRQTLKPTLGFTMGDDVENDSQHFILKLATDSGFTKNVQTFDTRESVTGWTYDDGQTFPAAGLDYTHEGHIVSYTLQNNLVEGTLYYWKVAPVDVTTNSIGTYSSLKTLKVGTRLEVTLKNTLETSANAKRILVKVLRNIATDGNKPAELKIFSCNNGLDVNPTWEDITKNILDETYHVFTNATKTADNWAVNIKIIVEANDSTGPIEILGFGFSFD